MNFWFEMAVNEMCIRDSNTATAGTIGGGCSESAVMRQAYYLIGTGEHKCVTIDMSNDIAAQEGMVCGGQMKVLLADLVTKKIDIK